MQHVFLIKAVCGLGWIHMFGRFSFGRKQPICCDVATTTGTNLGDRITSCRVVVLECQIFAFCPCVSLREGEKKNLYELICIWAVMTWWWWETRSSAHKLNPLVSQSLSVESLWCQALSGIFEDVLQLCQCLGGVMSKLTHTRTHTQRYCACVFCYWSQWSISVGFFCLFPCSHP